MMSKNEIFKYYWMFSVLSTSRDVDKPMVERSLCSVHLLQNFMFKGRRGHLQVIINMYVNSLIQFVYNTIYLQ